MIAAAPVITPAVFSRPKAIAARLSPSRSVALPHAGEEEDRVVDREAEGDAEDRRGADGVDVGVAAERVAGGDLAGEGDTPIAAATEARLRTTARAASSGARRIATSIRKVSEDDRADDERQARLGRRAVVVEDGGAAGEAGLQAALAAESPGVGERGCADRRASRRC